MANNTAVGGKVAHKGGRPWRWGRGPVSRRVSGSDDASDEEYVVGADGEEEDAESSDASYSSDASREAFLDAEDSACSEEDEEAGDDEQEYDPAGEEEIVAARGRRPRKRIAYRGRQRRAASPFVVVEVEEEAEDPLVRKPRAMRRRRPAIPAEEEGDEGDDDDDEDFAPDEDEDDDEEPAREGVPLRKGGGRRNGSVKRRGRKGRPRKSSLGEKVARAPATRKKRRRTVIDDDFVVRNRRISVESNKVEKKKEKKRAISSGGRKRRRSWASCSDPSESDSSDFDYATSVEEARDLPVGRPLGHHLVRRPLSSGAQGEKGKRKDDGDLGKQVCRICLSEEKKGVLRGLLDCCAHYFCYACIMEWSKVESRCPLCKRRFKTIRRSASSDAGLCLRTAVIKIPERDQVYQPSEEEIRGYLDPYANVVCIECQQGGDDNLMLLCDICDSPAHTYCVGLGREVPEGNWYCDGCRSTDLGSSNPRVQESVVEHGVRIDGLQVNFHGMTDSENASICMPHEPLQRLATLSCQLSSDGIGESASNRHPSSVGGHETALQVPGFMASTVLGRRSIHHRIRIMINNRVRWIPEEVARNNVIRPSSMGSAVLGYEAEQHRETFCVQQEGLTNGVDERSNRPFLGSRVNMHPCTHNEGSSCNMVEGAHELSQW